MKKQIAFLLALALLLTSCGSGTAAATMRLRKTEGTVGVSDGEGQDISLKNNLGLYSGYQVSTQAESYAWIDLDSVKLTKMDADSQVEITKNEKLLDIEVKSGSLLFNVTEPLADDESLNIRTSTMAVGIRGTCGWVSLSQDGNTLTVYLLEGEVECTNGEDTATVSAGERGTIPASGEITVAPFAAAQVPAFVRAELENNNSLAEAVTAASGIDVLNTPTIDFSDPIRVRDMYTYSRVLVCGPNGELVSEQEYFPDEQGRIGTQVNHQIISGAESVGRHIYNDAGALQAIEYENGIAYTVIEDTVDYRRVAPGDHIDWEYIFYYDEQGRETRQDRLVNGVLESYRINTFDEAGRLIRSDWSIGSYNLYEYD